MRLPLIPYVEELSLAQIVEEWNQRQAILQAILRDQESKSEQEQLERRKRRVQEHMDRWNLEQLEIRKEHQERRELNRQQSALQNAITMMSGVMLYVIIFLYYNSLI